MVEDNQNKRFLVRLSSNGPILGCHVKYGRNFIQRFVGLMFKNQMDGFDGLIIEPCNSIHTFFMKYSIDVVFLDSKNVIVKILRNIPPWRMTGIYFKASKVLEFKANTIPEDCMIGTLVEVICIN